MLWPDLIRRYRRERGVTQMELSRLLNVDQATISRWESGKQDPLPMMQTRLQGLFRDLDRLPLDYSIRALLKGYPGYASLMDANGVCRMTSPTLAAYLERNRGSILGRPMYDYLPEHTQSLCAPYWADMMRPGSPLLSMTYTDRAVFSDAIVRRTYNVLVSDNGRMLMVQDHVIGDLGEELPPPDIVTITMDDVVGDDGVGNNAAGESARGQGAAA